MARRYRRSFKLSQPFLITDRRTLAFLLTALRFAEPRYISPADEDMILSDPWDNEHEPGVNPLDIASFDDVADLLNAPETRSDRRFWVPGRKAARPSRPYGRQLG